MIRRLYDMLYSETPAEFPSEFGLSESVQRLSEAVGRPRLYPLSQQAAGRVDATRVRLERSTAFIQNPFKPYFVGAFQEQGQEVALVGHFGLHVAIRIFMTVWLGFCLVWTVLAAAMFFSDEPVRGFLCLGGLGMFALGCCIVCLGKRFARNDIAWLSQVVGSAMARPAA